MTGRAVTASAMVLSVGLRRGLWVCLSGRGLRAAPVVLVVGALGLGGCQDGAAQATTNVACAVVTRDEVSYHLGGDDALAEGRPAVPGTPPPIGVTGMDYCIFLEGEKSQMVAVGVTPEGADATFARQLFEDWTGTGHRHGGATTRSSDSKLEPVADLGVEAMWNPTNTGGQLVVLTDRRVLGVFMSMLDLRPDLNADTDGGARERARLLASMLIDRGLAPVFDDDEDDREDGPAEPDPPGERGSES